MGARVMRVVVALTATALVHVGGAFADVGDTTTFTDPAGNIAEPEDITLGLDGNYWFTNFGNGRIGRITTAGAVTTFADPAGNLIRPFGITAGPDGNIWFTDFRSNVVGRITPAGAIATFGDPSGNVDLPRGITSSLRPEARADPGSTRRRASPLHGVSS
jgi:streptogramin lyase